MFTGIIEELGTIRKVVKTDTGKQFSIKAKLVLDDLKVGDSIAVNGVCLTAVKVTKTGFTLDLVHETLEKSNLGDLQIDNDVNLERPLTLSTRLGGHILQGHIESVGVIVEKEIHGEGATIVVALSPNWMRFCIPKGSIALDGVSLTIASLRDNFVSVALIPHTLDVTTLGSKDKGDTLNVETDIIGKYIDRLLSFEEFDDQDDSYLSRMMDWGFGES